MEEYRFPDSASCHTCCGYFCFHDLAWRIRRDTPHLASRLSDHSRCHRALPLTTGWVELWSRHGNSDYPYVACYRQYFWYRKISPAQWWRILMLEVHNIFKTYEGKLLLNDISFMVAESETICLLGASGSGKSTLLRIIAGLETSESGLISFNGLDLTNTPPHLRDFGLVFQDYA